MSVAIPTKSRPTRRLDSIHNAAEYLGVSTKTIRRFIASGDLTGYRAGKKIIRVDLNEVDAMLRPIPTAESTEPPGGSAAIASLNLRANGEGLGGGHDDA